MAWSGTTARVALILVIVLLLGALNAASLSAYPAGEVADSGRLMGRAGFAYITGIRTYAAAVLWNRLEPQFHTYYERFTLAEQTQMMPTIRLVQTLDPQFVDAYYVASWVLGRKGTIGRGLDLAREGIRANPDVGLLRASYIQLLYLRDKSPATLAEAAEQANAGIDPAMRWRDETEQFEAYAVFAAAYKLAGQTEREAAVRAMMLQLDERIESEGGSIGDAGHDHDGDGKPDH